MSDNHEPVAVNTLSRKENNVTEALHESAEAWFCTGTQEEIGRAHV